MSNDDKPIQRSIFELQTFTNPVARNKDPSTSHMAEAFINGTGKRSHQCRLALAAVTATQGLTSRELSERHGLDNDGIHKRLSDLKEKGLVEWGCKRQCDVSGRQAMTWCLRRVNEPDNGPLFNREKGSSTLD